MGWRERYEGARDAMLADPAICSENRELFAEFFRFEEYKLKRQNGLPELDEGCCKTLYAYIMRIRNVEAWFEHKSWKAITKEDIKRVYDALEDGAILTKNGQPFRDRTSYYNKIFKSKPFRLAGKDVLAREVIEFSTAVKSPVRFLTESEFRKIVSVVANPTHLLLLWLAWDIGENISSLLQLTPRDFTAQANRHTGEREYVVNLRPTILKRSRRSRSEVTLYPETARFLDMMLPRGGPDDPIFRIGYRHAAKLLERAVHRCGATTMPLGEQPRWKDLRSGMACHLLRSGWTRDEVNARLGHTPHSAELDAYVNFLALDRDRPKLRMSTPVADSRRGRLGIATIVRGFAADDLEHEQGDIAVRQQHARSSSRDELDALHKVIDRVVIALRELSLEIIESATNHNTAVDRR